MNILMITADNLKNENIVIFAAESFHAYGQPNTLSIMDYKFINTEYLDSVSGGDPDIICELVTLFKEQSVEISGEMKLLFDAKNYKLLGLLAHKAKSSVSIMGMNDLAIMLKTFELQAREEKEPHLYESYIARFLNETREAVTELEDLANKLLNRN
jgi:HPt (histidine-containing phosphotransfer) domain-containing protein